MSSKVNLKLDWCSHAAAKFACEHWHYSGSVPPPPIVRVGVWENGEFIGCVMFARGASNNLLKPYGLETTQGAELVRVALNRHQSPVSRIMAIAMRMLRKQQPGLRLLVSFADPAQDHHGGIYQACGWFYAGMSSPTSMYRDSKGKLWHERMTSTTGSKKCYGKYQRVPRREDCERVHMPGKHRYLMPLDDAMREQIEPLRQPYPKRVRSADSGTSGDQPEGGGATPTRTL
jgi:hypothetical protein